MAGIDFRKEFPPNPPVKPDPNGFDWPVKSGPISNSGGGKTDEEFFREANERMKVKPDEKQ